MSDRNPLIIQQHFTSIISCKS